MMNTMIDNFKRLKQRALCKLKKLEKADLYSIKTPVLRMRTAGLLAGILAFVWWCVLYPELCFPQDTYETVYETGEENTEAGDEGAIWLLQAEEEQVIVKSRLLEWLGRHKAE